MQEIEKTIRKIIIVLGIFMLLSTILIEYAFNIQFFHQVVIVGINLIVFSILVYFYLNPKFLVQKRKEILLLITCILIFLIFMESILGINACGGNVFEFFPDEELKYKYVTSTKICNPIKDDNKKFYVMTNNEGFIDEDFEFNEEDYNIFLIGDSFAACLESDYNNCVHQKLEKDLKGIYGDNINILNFGVSSYGSFPELEVLKKYKDIYKPKMVILYFFGENDLYENEIYLNRIHKDYYSDYSKNLIRKITPKTSLFVMTKFKNIMDKILINSEIYREKTGIEERVVRNFEPYLEEYGERWENLLKIELDSLEEIYSIGLEDDIIILHVAVTTPEQVYEEDWESVLETYPSLKDNTYILSKPNDIVMNFAEENGIYHLDLVPLFKENPKYLHLPIDGHWNDEGQLFAGEKIKEYILENDLIR